MSSGQRSYCIATNWWRVHAACIMWCRQWRHDSISRKYKGVSPQNKCGLFFNEYPVLVKPFVGNCATGSKQQECEGLITSNGSKVMTKVKFLDMYVKVHSQGRKVVDHGVISNALIRWVYMPDMNTLSRTVQITFRRPRFFVNGPEIGLGSRKNSY